MGCDMSYNWKNLKVLQYVKRLCTSDSVDLNVENMQNYEIFHKGVCSEEHKLLFIVSKIF